MKTYRHPREIASSPVERLRDVIRSVRQALVQVNQSTRFEDPKTTRGTRTISLDARTVTVLREHRQTMLEERVAVGTGFEDNGLVFCKVDGTPLLPSSFSQSFDRMVARSDLPRIRLHDLRHTSASLMLQGGVPIKVVSERLGHASTELHHGHLLPRDAGMQGDAAEKLDGLIFGTDS